MDRDIVADMFHTNLEGITINLDQLHQKNVVISTSLQQTRNYQPLDLCQQSRFEIQHHRVLFPVHSTLNHQQD